MPTLRCSNEYLGALQKLLYCPFLRKEETIRFFWISTIFWGCCLALVEITIYLIFLKTKRKSEALFMNHVTSYSTSVVDVTWVGFKSMFIYDTHLQPLHNLYIRYIYIQDIVDKKKICFLLRSYFLFFFPFGQYWTSCRALSVALKVLVVLNLGIYYYFYYYYHC